MNASADGDEPLGEAPELPEVVGWAQHIEDADNAIAEIRELHGRAHGVKLSLDSIPDDEAKWACGQCMVDGGPHDPGQWVEMPCPTVQILDKWGV